MTNAIKIYIAGITTDGVYGAPHPHPLPLGSGGRRGAGDQTGREGALERRVVAALLSRILVVECPRARPPRLCFLGAPPSSRLGPPRPAV